MGSVKHSPVRVRNRPSADRRDSGGIVTPEAVLLDFEIAGIGTRLIARIIDVFAQMFLIMMLSPLLGIVSVASAVFDEGAGSVVGIVLAIVGFFLLLFGYSAILETYGGQTLGKKVLHLRVVTLEGAPIRFGQAAIRSMMQVPDLYFPPGGALALISVLTTPRGQRLGDLAAGTFVVREVSPMSQNVRFRFPIPPGFEGYAAQLDVSMVTPDHYRVIRGFLTRVTELRPEVRFGMAQQLAQPVSQSIGHVIPPQVHPENFLACVANRYQQRHAPAPPVGGVASTMG